MRVDWQLLLFRFNPLSLESVWRVGICGSDTTRSKSFNPLSLESVWRVEVKKDVRIRWEVSIRFRWRVFGEHLNGGHP